MVIAPQVVLTGTLYDITGQPDAGSVHIILVNYAGWIPEVAATPPSQDLAVYYNGMRQNPAFFALDGAVVTLTFAPAPGSELLFDYPGASGGLVTGATAAPAPDGAASVFTLPSVPFGAYGSAGQEL